MDRLAKLVRTAAPSAGLAFRARPYGRDGRRDLLRDVIAMANAPVEGPRHIVVGIETDAGGHRTPTHVTAEALDDDAACAALVAEFIEPPVDIAYHTTSVDGAAVGVFEIGSCRDRPYMMRRDFSETLRRGDAYVRTNDAAVKLGRSQLARMFEQKFRVALSNDSIEVGFAGDILHKALEIQATDLTDLPSAQAAAKLRQMAALRKRSRARGSTTLIARLTYARLFGADDPYEDRPLEDLEEEIRAIRADYRDEDEHFLFAERGQALELAVLNQGEETVRDASLAIALPANPDFHVADRPPPVREDGELQPPVADEVARYPSVSRGKNAVRVAVSIGDLPPGEIVRVFDFPLRVTAGLPLAGRRFALQYSLLATNLRGPADGKLRLKLGARRRRRAG